MYNSFQYSVSMLYNIIGQYRDISSTCTLLQSADLTSQTPSLSEVQVVQCTRTCKNPHSHTTAALETGLQQKSALRSACWQVTFSCILAMAALSFSRRCNSKPKPPPPEKMFKSDTVGQGKSYQSKLELRVEGSVTMPLGTVSGVTFSASPSLEEWQARGSLNGNPLFLCSAGRATHIRLT